MSSYCQLRKNCISADEQYVVSVSKRDHLLSVWKNGLVSRRTNKNGGLTSHFSGPLGHPEPRQATGTVAAVSVRKANADTQKRERPIPLNGACHASYFSSAALPIHAPLQEKSSLATLGGHLSDRISAKGVGRRGHFLKGRFPPDFCYEAP